jgi:hypothetical protein
MASTRQIPWPPGSSRDRHRAGLTTATGQFLQALDTPTRTGWFTSAWTRPVQGRRRWTMRWKPALNAFDIAFDGRLSAGRK